MKDNTEISINNELKPSAAVTRARELLKITRCNREAGDSCARAGLVLNIGARLATPNRDAGDERYDNYTMVL